MLALRHALRDVAGLAFGPALWLAVSIDRGDANEITLRTGEAR